MRVVAGRFRSRPLIAPRGEKTRPTADKLRETLFNVLQPRIEAATFADLFAGSGAVGIEALSRGARHAFFAENAPAALLILRKNLVSLGIPAADASVCARGVANCLAAWQTPLDIVFLDPPYEDADAYSSTLHALAAGTLLADNATVIAEHSRRNPLAETYASLARYRVLEQGDAALSFYRAQ
jgi:16S rRNA (guanine966-N2)-methyltransferase